MLGTLTLASGETVDAYDAASVPFGRSCVKQTRTCTNGSLSGTYQNLGCSLETFTLSINGGDRVTRNSNVQLQLVVGGGSGTRSMYVTNTPGCTAGGIWEPFSARKNSWALAQSNASSPVFVKYRDARGVESACVSSSIIHDNIPPQAGVLAAPDPAACTSPVPNYLLSGTCSENGRPVAIRWNSLSPSPSPSPSTSSDDSGSGPASTAAVPPVLASADCASGKWRAEVNFKQLSDGHFQIWASQTDEAGNVAPLKAIDLQQCATRKSDELLLQHADGRLKFWILNGFRVAATGVFEPPSVDPAWRLISQADFNRDAQPDLVFQHADGNVMVWLMQGNRRIRSITVDPSPGPDQRLVTIADINKDRVPDLVFQSRVLSSYSTIKGNTVTFWLMGGPTSTNRQQIVTLNEPNSFMMTAVASHDMDRDGYPDLSFLPNENSLNKRGILFAFLTASGQAKSTWSSNFDFTFARYAGNGNYSRSGSLNLVLQSEPGRVFLQTFSQATFSVGGWLDIPLETGWHLAGSPVP